MRVKPILPAAVLVVALTGCGVTDLAKGAAQTAADATACKALGSTITSIAGVYQSGFVDSGLIAKIDSLVGEQARSLLSSGLAQDIGMLTETLKQTGTAESSKEKIQQLTDSITKRCSEAGVSIS